MTPSVFAIVLVAAALHAGWNAVVKLGSDKAATMLLLSLVQAALALPLLPFVPVPQMESWGWLLASCILHAGYKLFLTAAYVHGDLSQTYPIARGTAPLLVALVSVLFLGVSLGLGGGAAVVLISLGVLTMGLAGQKHLRLSRRGLGFALITAGFTASYTLVDGIGARVAGTAAGFVLWMVVLDALVMSGHAAVTRGASALTTMQAHWKAGILAGAMSLGSYWIAVWAFTQAPIALVAALRESSILFAMIIGFVWLREPVVVARLGAAALILAGILMMRI